jgi:hypothetical protein
MPTALGCAVLVETGHALSLLDSKKGFNTIYDLKTMPIISNYKWLDGVFL